MPRVWVTLVSDSGAHRWTVVSCFGRGDCAVWTDHAPLEDALVLGTSLVL
jgi:hypothetical protein